MATWEEIRDEVAGMLADRKPLEDVISKLDEMKNPKPMTNEQWLHTATTEQLADLFLDYRYINATPQQQLWLSANEEYCKNGIVKWLKEIHQ